MDRSDPLYQELFFHTDYLETRYTAIQLREARRVDAYPVFYKEFASDQKQKAVTTDIVQIALDALPVPDESTSWEQILEYRSDPDSQSKFLALRHWMNEVARRTHARRNRREAKVSDRPIPEAHEAPPDEDERRHTGNHCHDGRGDARGFTQLQVGQGSASLVLAQAQTGRFT